MKIELGMLATHRGSIGYEELNLPWSRLLGINVRPSSVPTQKCTTENKIRSLSLPFSDASSNRVRDIYEKMTGLVLNC